MIYSFSGLCVLDGPVDVDLDVLFAGGGVLLVLSVVHMFSFCQHKEFCPNMLA